MRFRSLMTLLFLSFTALGLVGCGSSGNSTEFVATNPAAAQTTGSLTFRFQPVAVAQTAFDVDAATARLVFRFFENGDASGQATDTRTHAFATEVVVENLSTSVRSVRITGLDANGIPLYTIVQPVAVVAGQDVIVNATGTNVPVVLSSLSFVPANSTSQAPLTSVNLSVGETAQVFLRATYDDGTVVVVNNAGAEFVNDPADPDSAAIFEVSATGSLRGLSAGSSAVIARFAGQTLGLPVEVSDSQNVTFTDLSFAVADPFLVEAGTSVAVPVTGTTSTGGTNVLASPSRITYDLVGDAVFSVSNGVVTVSEAAVGGEFASLTATYDNANGTTTTTDPLTLQVPTP